MQAAATGNTVLTSIWAPAGFGRPGSGNVASQATAEYATKPAHHAVAANTARATQYAGKIRTDRRR